MEEEEPSVPAVDPNMCTKTYSKADRTDLNPCKTTPLQIPTLNNPSKWKDLTTKQALEFLLAGTLKSNVCRYCLKVASPLSHLDQILHVSGTEVLYKVAIKDIIASFHPFKVIEDPNFPDRICENCLDQAIASYLFTQQCEQAERALLNCFEDLYEKLEKLDPLEQTKKRGRQKLHPNHNVLHAEHDKVIKYAEPIIHIINTSSEVLTEPTPISVLECLKCCEIFPNVESLINHTKIHPKTMWYNCRLCGTSFPKHQNLKKHFNTHHKNIFPMKPVETPRYDCKTCGLIFDKYYDYLEHLEKHKFKMVIEHVVEKKMDKLCALCFDKGTKMVSLDEKICVHGGSPELTGERSLYTVLSSTLPEMNIIDNYSGTKLCEKCLDNALTTYIFVNQTYFARNRLGTCISSMMEKLNDIEETNHNICIEISQNAILKVNEPFDETVDEINLNKIEVLEDEFRIESENDSETESHTDIQKDPKETLEVNKDNIEKEPKGTLMVTKNKNVEKTLQNGYKYSNDICGEFLTFKKKVKPKMAKFVCPVCSKHFISDYFLKRHILKHIPSNIKCHICGVHFKSKFDLYEHKRMFHIFNINSYLSCKICGRCFEKEVMLKHHETQHKNQLCKICDKKFKTYTNFITHMHRHMKKLSLAMKKYKQNCSFCEKECSNDNEFSLHVNKVHLQIKPYGCDMCESHFYTEINLKSHKKVHNVFSKEQCQFCNRILYSRKKLVTHIRKHIGDTPFFCQLCRKSFYSQNLLKKHIISKHGGIFTCKNCSTVFSTNRKLEEHMNQVHNHLI